MRIVLTFVSGEAGPIWTALDTGVFAKHGLAVDDIPAMAAATAYAALLSGEAQVSVGSISGLLPSIASGADFVAVATQSNGLAYFLMTQPSVTSVADLRGKIFAVGRPPGSEAYLGIQTLSTRGLEPDRDYEIRQIGGQAERATAVQAGAADFTVVSPPASTHLRQAGYRQLVDLAEARIPYAGVALATRKAYAEANRDLVDRLVRAYIEGLWRFRTDRATAYEVLRRHLQLDDPELLEETYVSQSGILEKVPYADPQAVATAIEVAAADRPELKTLKPEDITDRGFVQRAEASGFVRGLYGD
jgi:NitT/TauT family transport system substrate-binding protein